LHAKESHAERHDSGGEVVDGGDDGNDECSRRVSNGLAELGCRLDATEHAGVPAVEHEGGAAASGRSAVEGLALEAAEESHVELMATRGADGAELRDPLAVNNAFHKDRKGVVNNKTEDFWGGIR